MPKQVDPIQRIEICTLEVDLTATAQRRAEFNLEPLTAPQAFGQFFQNYLDKADLYLVDAETPGEQGYIVISKEPSVLQALNARMMPNLIVVRSRRRKPPPKIVPPPPSTPATAKLPASPGSVERCSQCDRWVEVKDEP